MDEKSTNKLLFPELSYAIVGFMFNVHKLFGSGHKESLYQEALFNEITQAGLNVVREPTIQVINPVTQQKLKSVYRPDLLVEDKIIIEIKAVPRLAIYFIDQLKDYLHNSKYELGYLVNFADKKLKPIRVIYTNDRKGQAVRAK